MPFPLRRKYSSPWWKSSLRRRPGLATIVPSNRDVVLVEQSVYVRAKKQAIVDVMLAFFGYGFEVGSFQRGSPFSPVIAQRC